MTGNSFVCAGPSACRSVQEYFQMDFRHQRHMRLPLDVLFGDSSSSPGRFRFRGCCMSCALFCNVHYVIMQLSNGQSSFVKLTGAAACKHHTQMYREFLTTGIRFLCILTPANRLGQHLSMLVRMREIITRFSCLHETRCVCRQAAVKGYHISYPLLDSPDPSKAQSTVATVLSISTAPRQPGPHM